MVRSHLSVMASVLCAVMISSGTVLSAEEGIETTRLRDTVVRNYRAQRAAIQSVECSYSWQLNGLLRECRYAWNSGKVYHASVDRLPQAASAFPREFAWDGSTLRYRSTINHMLVSRDREKGITSCQTPEAFVNSYVSDALKFDRHSFGYQKSIDVAEQYQFLSARESSKRDVPCIELSYRVAWLPGTLTVWHAKSFGCWPIHAEIRTKDGALQVQLADVQLAVMEVDGNTLYYPVAACWSTFLDKGTNVETILVDRGTLRINQVVAADRFVLEKWPSEFVYDADAERSYPPSDPNWSPRGRVDFPFAQLVASAPDAMIVPSAQVARATDDSQGAASNPPQRFTPPLSASGSGPTVLDAALWGGVGILFLGASLVFWQRRAK